MTIPFIPERHTLLLGWSLLPCVILFITEYLSSRNVREGIPFSILGADGRD